MHTKRIDHPKQQENEFPKLMISSKSGVILFATDQDENYLKGMIVSGHDYLENVGDYGIDWIKKNFSDYHGQVILSNHKIDE
jgi:hypothetical protein